MTSYGQPYFLEEKINNLLQSEFVDIHDRMKFEYRCSQNSTTGTRYMLYDTTSGSRESYSNPVLSLSFGSRNSLGTINFSPERQIPMNDYFSKSSMFGSSKDRKFVASDQQEYRWRWRLKDDHEWTCTNSRNYLVAYYTLKDPIEPEYCGSSGCMLTVDEPFGYLASELLASLMVMRHIARYNI